jgi:hypothetical protein
MRVRRCIIMTQLVRLYSYAGVPPKPDGKLMKRINSLEDVDFEEVAKIIREHRSEKRNYILSFQMPEADDRLTI